MTAGPLGAFERPERFDLAAAFPADPKLLGAASPDATARVLVDRARARAVERELGAERVVARHDDGSIEFDVPCANVEAFRSWVLGLLEHAVVVGPADARAAVVDWLRRTAGAGA